MPPEQQTSGATVADNAWAEVTSAVRPGSRADRMARPVVRDVLREVAEKHGVCTRPLVIRRVERVREIV